MFKYLQLVTSTDSCMMFIGYLLYTACRGSPWKGGLYFHMMFSVLGMGMIGNSSCSKLRGPSEGSDSEQSRCLKGASSIDLTLGTLESYHQLHGNGDSSQYASNGACPDRIKEILKSPGCSCGQCSMPFALLLRCCQSFWGLPKMQQDAILWSLQSVGGGRSTTWSLAGHWSC